MRDTFVSTMQQGQHQHLRLEFWNGAGCVQQDISAPVVPHMKELAQREHTGEFPWFSNCTSCLLILVISPLLQLWDNCDISRNIVGFTCSINNIGNERA